MKFTKYDVVEIEVPKWFEYQKTKSNTRHFFRLETDYLMNYKISTLTDAEVVQHLFILTECARQNRSKVVLSITQMMSRLRARADHISLRLNRLQENQLVKVVLVPKIREEKIREEKIREEKIREEKIREDKTSRHAMNPDSPDPPKNPEKKSGPKNPERTLQEIWNQNRGTFPECKTIGPRRERSMKARWAEKPDPVYWRDVVNRLRQSDFCNGVNDRGWVADFDFFVATETHHRALEGKYDNRKPAAPLTRKYSDEELKRMMPDG